MDDYYFCYNCCSIINCDHIEYDELNDSDICPECKSSNVEYYKLVRRNN